MTRRVRYQQPGPAVRGPWPCRWAVTELLCKASGQADVRSKDSTAKGPQTGLGRARSASMDAAPPTAGDAAGGGRFVRQAHLDIYDHKAGVKITVLVGKICEACQFKPAANPDNNYNCTPERKNRGSFHVGREI